VCSIAGRLLDGYLKFGGIKYCLPVLFSAHRGVRFRDRDHSGGAQAVVTSCVQSEVAVAVTAYDTVHCRRPGKVTTYHTVQCNRTGKLTVHHAVHCRRPGKVTTYHTVQRNRTGKVTAHQPTRNNTRAG
jgi:hypothetical protein